MENTNVNIIMPPIMYKSKENMNKSQYCFGCWPCMSYI